jgi:hypothetical protein
MKLLITRIILLSLIGTSTPIACYTGMVAYEAAKSEWFAKEHNISPIPLSQHFGNMALIIFFISLMIDISSAILLFKTLKSF